MDIYTTGGGYFVQDILQFLALYHGSNDFNVLLTIAITAGLLCLATTIVLGTQIRLVLRTFAIMLVVGSVFIGRTTSVDVHDKTYGTLSYYATVDNVPYGVALLARFTTGTSYFVTEKLEQLLSTPNDLSYQSNGMVFGATIVAQQARWRAVDNILHERMVDFYQNCIVRGINLRYFDMAVIVGATDLLAATDANIPASLSFFDVSTGAVETCAAGWAVLKTDINAALNPLLQKKAAAIFQENPASDGAATVAKLTNALQAMQTRVGMASATATTTVRQAMLINAFDDSIARYAAISGNDASLSNLTNSIADIQRRSTYASIGVAATKIMPYVKIVFETLYYGAFPFAVMLMMTPMAWAVFKGYCGGFVWIASWEPLSAILHGIVLEAASRFYGSATVQTSDGQPTGFAMTWSNHFGVIAAEQDIGALAGMMMMAVPTISLFIFLGARGMGGVASNLLNVGHGPSAQAGQMASTGNVQLSTVGMNSMNANNWQTSSNVDTGRLNGYFPTGGTYTQNRDGTNNYGGGSSHPRDTVANVTADQGIRRELRRSASTARTAARTQMSETANYINQGASQFSSYLESANDTQTNATTNSRSLSAEDSSALRSAERTLEQASQSAGIDSQILLKTALAASVGLPKGASLGGDLGINAQSVENANRTWQAATSKEVQDALSTVERIGTTDNWGDSASIGTSANQGDRWSLDQGRRMSESLAKQLRVANDYSYAESQANTQGVASGQQLTGFLAKALEVEFPNNPQAVDRILNARDFDALSSQQSALENVVGEIVSFYAADRPVTDGTQGFDASSHYRPDQLNVPQDTVGAMHDEFMATSSEMATAHGQRAGEIRRRRETAQILADAAHGRINDQVDEGRSQTVGGEVVERSVGVAKDTGGGLKSLAHEFNTNETIQGMREPGSKWRRETAQPWVAEQFDRAQEWLKKEPQPTEPTPRGNTGDIRSHYRKSQGHEQQSSLPLTHQDRDATIRTVLGEAGNQGPEGMAAVAHVIKNRSEDPRWPSTPQGVALQPLQFSSWNMETNGYVPNNRFNTDSVSYERAGQIVDQVFAGDMPDNTGGAVNFYAPKLMAEHAEQGKVAGPVPGWYDQVAAERGAPDAIIGDHIFTGQKRS